MNTGYGVPSCRQTGASRFVHHGISRTDTVNKEICFTQQITPNECQELNYWSQISSQSQVLWLFGEKFPNYITFLFLLLPCRRMRRRRGSRTRTRTRKGRRWRRMCWRRGRRRGRRRKRKVMEMGNFSPNTQCGWECEKNDFNTLIPDIHSERFLE